MPPEKNTRVVFYGFRKTPYPNLGIAYLVSHLRKQGFNYDYQYLEAEEDLEKAAQNICRSKPDIVGLTACSIDFNKVKHLSRSLKDACDPVILLGGAHISSVPSTLPPHVDIGFLGESEETAVEVFTLLRDGKCTAGNLKKLNSITFYDEGGTLQINERRPYQKVLDVFPHPARDIFSKDYWKDGVTSLLTSRGCPFHCAFCQVTAQWRVCRYHSAEYVVEEIRDLAENYGIHTFGVVDDLFIANKPRLAAIKAGLEKAGLLGKVRFAVNGRANLMNERLVKLLKSMGVVEIAMGLESMSPKILSLLKDHVTVEDNIRAVDTIYNCGLRTGGLYMVGTPGESLEDLEQTYDYVNRNRHKFGGMQVCITTPLPNTRLWDLCVAKGRINPDIEQFDWDKLNLAAEDVRSNLYVGDLDEKTFARVLDKFRWLFFQPAARTDTRVNKAELTKQMIKAAVSAAAITNAVTRPSCVFRRIAEYVHAMREGTRPSLSIQGNERLLYSPDNCLIDAAKTFREPPHCGLKRVQEMGDKFYRVDRAAEVQMVGTFGRVTLAYKTKDLAAGERTVAIMRLGGKTIPVPGTHGQKRRADIHDRRREPETKTANRHHREDGQRRRLPVRKGIGRLRVDYGQPHNAGNKRAGTRCVRHLPHRNMAGGEGVLDERIVRGIPEVRRP